MVVIKAENKYQVVTNFTLSGNPEKTGFGKERYENILNTLKKQEGVISEEYALELLNLMIFGMHSKVRI